MTVFSVRRAFIFLALVLIPTSAFAEPASFNWSGFYVGGHGGGAWGDRRWDESQEIQLFGLNFPVARNVGVNGSLAGGQLGYDHQFGRWVFGGQVDVAWTNLRGNARCNDQIGGVGVPYTCESRAEWFATATARLGYTFDRTLVYGKIGLARVKEQYLFSRANATSLLYYPMFAGRDQVTGLVMGAGVEYAFFKNWSAFVEYNYYHFATNAERVFGTGNAPNVDSNVYLDFKVRPEMHVAKVGINYRFNRLAN